jgi:hypothetical protein
MKRTGKRVTRKIGLTALFVSAVLMIFISATGAQSRVWEGDVMPMNFGSYGERHYHIYGYYGTFVPADGFRRQGDRARALG